MSNDDLNEEKSNKWIFIMVAIITVLLPFIIFGAVYCININQIPILYDKKDVLAYYGSIIGACFTGFITAGGLYYTLKQNSETFNRQREIDKKAMNKQIQQFNKDYNLKLINQKLDKYKEIYLLNEQIINKVNCIHSKLDIEGYLKENSSISSDINSIFTIHNELTFMIIFITETDLINYYNLIKTFLMSLNDKTIDYYQGKLTFKEYENYYIQIMEKYAHFATLLTDISKKIYMDKIANDM